MLVIRRARRSDKAQLLQLAWEFHTCTVMNRGQVPKRAFELIENLNYATEIKKNVSKYIHASKGNNGKEAAFVAVDNTPLIGFTVL